MPRRNVSHFPLFRSTGVGIPPSRRKEVLGSFSQGSRHSGGYGLGLAMVKNLVALMGGAIRIEDKAGPGTLFRFNIVLEFPPEDSPDRRGNPVCPPETTFEVVEVGRSSSRGAGLRRTSSTESASDFPRRERSVLSRVEGSTVLLLKRDPSGRAPAAAWMTRRGLRVYQAERWGDLRETFRRLLGTKPSARSENLDGDADLPAGKIGNSSFDASSALRVRKPSQIWPSENAAKASEVGPPESHLFGQLSLEGGPSKQNRGNSPGTFLLILDTSVVPGFPSPDALPVALRSLMGDYDPTAPKAPRVAVAWLVSFALPGAVYEEIRAASGCGIIAYDVLHPSRLLSLLTTMVSDARNSDALLGSAVPASVPVRSENGLSKVHRSRKPIVILTEDEQQEVMIRSGLAFASTRGAVDEKGPESPTSELRTPPNCAERRPPADSAELRTPAGFADGPTFASGTTTTREATNSIAETQAPPPPPAEASVSQTVTGLHKPGMVRNAAKPVIDPGKEGLPLAGVHILMVEDTVLLRKLATTILTRVGARVFAVENGRQVGLPNRKALPCLLAILYLGSEED